MKNQQPTPKLSVTARAPFHVYYEGPAEVVSATNKVGRFDILPGHADFFSMLSPCEVAIEVDEKTDPIVFTIDHGIITARDDEVMLFVNM